MTIISRALAVAALLVLSLTGRGAAEPLTPAQALQYFQEADAISRADGGQLWGVSLDGPLLLVDPETRIAYANQPDTEARLRRFGEGLRGQIPTDVNLANTAIEWSGVKWSMYTLPLPEDRQVRAVLLLHELWHRVQDQLGLPSSAAANSHLDTRDGRYWMQLEWRALAAALAAESPNRAEAIADAALFRERRRAIFPGAAAQENEMELHEGLAEYTGVKLSGALAPARFVIEHELAEAPEKESFIRSFAYASGPAYGLLLDATGDSWRQNLTPKTDLGATLLQRSQIKLPRDIAAEAERRARVYGSAELAAKEDARAAARRILLAEYRARLVEGPVLKIPLREMQLRFDPGNLVPLDSLGTIYPNLRIVDDWGVLTVTSRDALVSPDFSQVSLAAPASGASPAVAGDGWSLELKQGWSIVPGARKGDFQLQSSRAP